MGPQLKGCCPIHKGTNPKAFVVDPRKNVWRCFGDCGRGGTTLELVAALEGVGIGAAAELLAQWFALPGSTDTRRPQQQWRKHMAGQPSHKAFVVEDRGEGDDKDAFWTRVGSAWPHADGKGLNIQLASGLAVSGRLVLREYTPDDAEADKKAKRKK
jgi:hypothetical protein